MMDPVGDNLGNPNGLSVASHLQVDSCAEVQTDPEAPELAPVNPAGSQENFHAVHLAPGVSSEIVVVKEEDGLVTLCNNPKPTPVMLPVQTATDPEEPLAKRICLEQGGQTFVLALQDGTQSLASAPIDPTATLIQPQNIISSGQASNDDVSQAWFTSREDKTFFQNKGHLWRQGMWSKDEIELLENNIRQYCEEHDITDPATIIFEMSKDGRKDFYRTIAKGLNRPLFSVYRRVIRMYDDKNHVGKYTPEELEKLKKLRSIYGNDWQAIGAALGRSASSIKDRCRLMKENCNQGKWLQAEERRLAEAVYELANAIPGEMISSGLSWAAVAERVATRSEKQCRTKWLNYLNWKEAGGTEWTREDDMTLIYRVCSLNVSDENCIDWNEMAKNWASVRSPQWLRGKWWSLKRHVPDHTTLPFSEVCEYLFQHYAQKIKKEEQAALVERSSNVVNSPEPADSVMDSSQSRNFARRTPTILRNVRTTPIPVTPVTPIVTAPLSVPSILTTAVPSPIATAPQAVSIATPVTAAPLGMSPMLQTLEVLPQGIQLTPTSAPQTFLLTHPTQPAIPLAATVSPNQIIIQAVSADTIANNENVTVQMNAPPQIIISAGGQIASLTPDQLTATALATEHLQVVPQEEADDVVGAPMNPHTQSPMIAGENAYESQVMREAEDVPEMDEPVSSIAGEQMPDEVKEAATHLILSDPMLGGDNSSELIGSSDVEADKTPVRDDALDSVTGDDV